jgi:pimeloyl-ACP methyl ester carboxylesterase
VKPIRRFVPAAHGTMHVASCGAGPAILLLHQTPRSWDEYRDVLPLLGRHHQAIAIDTPGFGGSDPVVVPGIEAWAAAAWETLDALGVGRAVLVGHHTGAVIALEMAASQPGRAAALILSSCPMVDAPRRAAHAGHRVIDDVERRPDGAHLVELWSRRAPYYPPGDIGLLERFVADALRAGPLAVAGHQVVNAYRMEDRIGQIACPTLVIDAAADPHAHPAAARIAAAIPGARLHVIEAGMVPLPDQLPAAFAQAIEDFLQKETPPWTRT